MWKALVLVLDGPWVRDIPSSAALCCTVIGSRGLDICKRAGIEISCDAVNGPKASDNPNKGNSLASTLSTAGPCFSLLNSDYRSLLFHLPYFSGFSCPLCTCLRVCPRVCVNWSFNQALYGRWRLSDTFFSVVYLCVLCYAYMEKQTKDKHRNWMECSGKWCWHTSRRSPCPLSFCSWDAYRPWQIRGHLSSSMFESCRCDGSRRRSLGILWRKTGGPRTGKGQRERKLGWE